MNFTSIAKRNQFKMTLANEKCFLRNLLSQNDILDKSILDNCLRTASDRLKLVCLRHVSDAGKDASVVNSSMLTPDSYDTLTTAIAGIGSGIGGLFLANMTVATTTTGMLWWKTTTDVSLAAAIAAALGVGAGIATGGIAILAGLGGGYAVSKLTKNIFKEKLINKIMSQYETETVPKLTEWFDKEIADSESDSKSIGW